MSLFVQKIFRKIKRKLYVMKKYNITTNKQLSIIELKDIVQDCNINFLIGAGLSTPYISLLGHLEHLLTKLSETRENSEIEKNQEQIIRTLLYKKIFDNVIRKNINILSWSERLNNENLKSVLNSYQDFIKTVNTIILNRKSTILSKQVNIFTTNFDIFLEKAMETSNVEYNDGFSGRFNPKFSLSNFKKSIFKRSLHYDNVHEIPVFNLMKLHGSLTWKKKLKRDDIYFHKNLKLIKELAEIEVDEKELLDIQGFQKTIQKSNKITIGDLIDLTKDKKLTESAKQFIYGYEKLAIVNPTKEKFKQTILNRNYYDLLRVYSTELEKENTVLFVMGFSFSDEHIRDVTIRTANSNPTLKIYIFAYTEKDRDIITQNITTSNINNKNIQIVPPKKVENKNTDEIKMDFGTINNKIFKPLL